MSAAHVEWLSSKFWRTDTESVGPADRRAALYALRMLDEYPEARSRLQDKGFLCSIWLLLYPLVEPAELDRHLTARSAPGDVGSDNADEMWLSRSDRALIAVGRSMSADRFLASDDGADRMRDDFRKRLDLSRDWLIARLDRLDPDGLTHPSLDLLAKALKIEPLERCLLDMAGLSHQIRAFGSLLTRSGASGDMARAAALAACCRAPASALRRWLIRGGALVRFQLLEESSECDDLEDCLMPTDLLREIMASEASTVPELLALMIEPVGTAECVLADFPHLAKDARAVSTTLRHAAQSQARGVNALFYGPPGTGKTQFALAIAVATELRAFRVSAMDEDGDSLRGGGRLGAFRLAQQLLAGATDCLLVFDEVEDVFGADDVGLTALLGLGHGRYKEKGWMNRTLEENAVPTIWITNDAASMDPAFLRRFLLPVAFSTPPREVRRGLVERYLGSAPLPDTLLDEVADDALQTPAQLAAAGRLLSLQPNRPSEIVVSESLASMRRLLHGSSRSSVRRASARFDPAYLNLAGDTTPSEIADMLGRCGQGRLCFFGPPGTGKTAFAHVLADAMNRELVVKRGSDIVSPCVGQTEIHIAQMFNDVDVEREVLLIDEVDGLLRRRDQARYSWEVTQVNELLQQMEAFPGILITATNRVEDLDPAVLRRFDFKLHFRPLNRVQRRALFERELSQGIQITTASPTIGDSVVVLPDEVISPAVVSKLDTLDGLTAGDFANVARQRELLGRRFTAEEFLRRLVVENRYREKQVIS